jgi:polyisoprenoid-binding protein YceI
MGMNRRELLAAGVGVGMGRMLMEYRIVVSHCKTTRAAFLCMVAGGAFWMAAVSSLAAQAPGPVSPGGAGRTPPPPPTAGANLQLVDGSASYQVTEQLAGINFPSQAIGASTVMSGTLDIAPDGSIAPGSKLTVDLRGLKSDQEMRDNYLQKRTLQTDQYPTAVFVPSKIEGMPKMIPFEGQTGVELTGDLTVHGVTKPVTFQGIATFGRDGSVAGRAMTSFDFATFGLTKPSLARLMSVGDKIDLNVVYKFKRD